jgi:hypothetical protein
VNKVRVKENLYRKQRIDVPSVGRRSRGRKVSKLSDPATTTWCCDVSADATKICMENDRRETRKQYDPLATMLGTAQVTFVCRLLDVDEKQETKTKNGNQIWVMRHWTSSQFEARLKKSKITESC